MEAIAIGIIIMAGAIFMLSCVFVVVTFCREWEEMEKNRPYCPLVWLKWKIYLFTEKNALKSQTSLITPTNFFTGNDNIDQSIK